MDRRFIRILAMLIITLAYQFIITSSFAQAPQKMSYQAVIRNTAGALVQSSPISMRVSILQGSITGTEVYKEIYNPNPQTNANGLVTIEIGGGIPVTGTFSGINWSNGPYFIKIETDPAGGTNYSITNTSQLLSVPYALHSKTADSLSGASNTFKHYIGELYGGGIVVGVWKEAGVEKGLITSLTDISIGAAWSNIATTDIGLTAQSLYEGQTNTNAIIAQVGHYASAAKICNDYTSGGYNDWYLPSVWELRMCYNSALIVNKVLGATNGFQWNYYWSSTEYDNDDAYVLVFYNGNNIFPNKGNTHRVRAVRRF